MFEEEKRDFIKFNGDNVGEIFHMNPSLYWNAWISLEMCHDIYGARSHHALVIPFEWDNGNGVYIDPDNPENESWKIIPG